MNRSLSQEAEKTLNVAKTWMRERRAKQEEERNKTLAFMSRQQRVAAPFHEKLYRHALSAAGIEVEELNKRHQAESDSAMRFLDERRQAALNVARDVNLRHRSDIEERMARWEHFAPPPPPPPQPSSPIVASLTSAMEINLTANLGDSSIAPNANIARTKVERKGWVSSLQWDLRGDLATVDWQFLWNPPRDGLLNVLTLLAMNGFGAVYPGPGCMAGSASWSIDSELALTQFGANGQPFRDSVTTRLAEDNFNSSDIPSSGGIILTGTHLDDVPVVTYPNRFPVMGQVPLLITVSATLYVLVAHGQAELNFIDGDFQLNVPFVYLFMD